MESARRAADQQRQQAQRDQSIKEGALAVVLDNVREARRSLSDSRYAQIQARYRKQLIEVRLGHVALQCVLCHMLCIPHCLLLLRCW
jgi:hypothetical protein